MILLREKFQLIACQTTKFVRERGLLVSNRVRKGTIAPQRDGGGEGCATGGEASADVVERQRGFQGKPKQRSHRPQHREGRVPLKGAVSEADWG